VLLAKTGERGLLYNIIEPVKILWGTSPHIRRGFAAPPSPKGEGYGVPVSCVGIGQGDGTVPGARCRRT